MTTIATETKALIGGFDSVSILDRYNCRTGAFFLGPCSAELIAFDVESCVVCSRPQCRFGSKKKQKKRPSIVPTLTPSDSSRNASDGLWLSDGLHRTGSGGCIKTGPDC